MSSCRIVSIKEKASSGELNYYLKLLRLPDPAQNSQNCSDVLLVILVLLPQPAALAVAAGLGVVEDDFPAAGLY